jgi:DNA-binding protein YbaB
MISCKISDDALRLNDKEMLEDLVVAATKQAMAKVREQIAQKTAEMAGNLGLPPQMLGGLGGLV